MIIFKSITKCLHKGFFSLWKCLENFMNIYFFTFLFSLPVYKIFHVLCDKELDHFLFNFVLFANVVCSTIKRVVQRNLFCHYCTNRKVTFFLLFIVVANTSQPGNVDLRIFAEFNGIKEKRREPLHPHRTSFVLSFFWRKKNFRAFAFLAKIYELEKYLKVGEVKNWRNSIIFLFHRCRACWDYN